MHYTKWFYLIFRRYFEVKSYHHHHHQRHHHHQFETNCSISPLHITYILFKEGNNIISIENFGLEKCCCSWKVIYHIFCASVLWLQLPSHSPSFALGWSISCHFFLHSFQIQCCTLIFIVFSVCLCVISMIFFLQNGASNNNKKTRKLTHTKKKKMNKISFVLICFQFSVFVALFFSVCSFHLSILMLLL